MDWKETVRQGKRNFGIMVNELEYEIKRLRLENNRLRDEIKSLKEKTDEGEAVSCH